MVSEEQNELYEQDKADQEFEDTKGEISIRK
jgi:hypothetical protein